MITHGLWQRRYGGSRDVIGRRLIVERAAVHDRGRDAARRRVPARRRGLDDGGRQRVDADERRRSGRACARRRPDRPAAPGRDARAGDERARGADRAARGRRRPPDAVARLDPGRALLRGRRRGRRAPGPARAVRRRRARAAHRERERGESAAPARRGAGGRSWRCAPRSAPGRGRLARQLLAESLLLALAGRARSAWR